MQVIPHLVFVLTDTLDCSGPAPGNEVCCQPKVMVNLCQCLEFPWCPHFCSFRENNLYKSLDCNYYSWWVFLCHSHSRIICNCCCTYYQSVKHSKSRLLFFSYDLCLCSFSFYALLYAVIKCNVFHFPQYFPNILFSKHFRIQRGDII